MLGEHRFVDALWIQLPRRNLLGDESRRPGDLPAAPVVESEDEVEARVPGGLAGSVGHVTTVAVGNPWIVHVAGEQHSHTLAIEFVAAPEQEVLVEPHEKLDLLIGTGPVLRRKGEGGDPFDPQLQRAFDRVEQSGLACHVTGGARKPAGIRPAPVPIQDQADVTRHRRQVDPGQVGGHSSPAKEANQRSRWYSTKRRATPIASPDSFSSETGSSVNSARSNRAM